jgi:lysophospholipase L1-like esterase
MNGAAYLMPCLRSHRPLDVVAIMLGTNDLKRRVSRVATYIATGMGALLKMVAQSESGPNCGAPKMLAICPPPILGHHGELPDFADMFAGG